jgi:hypothetical protein
MATEPSAQDKLIAELDATYAAIDRELAEYSKLANILPAYQMAEATRHRLEADRLTKVAHGIVAKLMGLSV